MDGYFDINPQTYDWCVRIFDGVRKLLGVRIKMHHVHGQVQSGDIFLFNHFARMETFIPQYLIYHETGAFCRSIAASEFFQRNDRFSTLLRAVGAIPNDHPDLMSILAVDILKGRKVVVFPEGGMVKDRRVVDDRGRYSIYSRSSHTRRKHHSGAARLAVGLQIFKHAVLETLHRRDNARLDEWAEQLGIASTAALIEAARKPTVVVPGNITFYPLRISENILLKGAELLPGKLTKRAVEELVVEGNLLLKATDMDIRLGDSIEAVAHWGWWERFLAGRLAGELPRLQAIYDPTYLQRNWIRRTATASFRASIYRLRDRYMRDIYHEVTVNLSHLASLVILKLLEHGIREITYDQLCKTLYLAIKRVQKHPHIHLHRSLCDPSLYSRILDADLPELGEFLQSAVMAELIEFGEPTIRFNDKLAAEHKFDEIRLENPIEVYANEAGHLKEVRDDVSEAIKEQPAISPTGLAQLYFDDELVALEWDKKGFDQPKHGAINGRETATADPTPFLLVPTERKMPGVVLVHGFLASPAEVREFGQSLYEAGFPVIGVRLKGHGTSPWDLRERTWQDWLASVERGYSILGAYADQICLVGFSTGGALSLVFGATHPPGLAGVVSIGTPIKFKNRNMRFVPLMHGANRVVRWLSTYEGLMPFRPNESEHPHINYRNMPIRGLFELTRLASYTKSTLPEISCPVRLIQATGDQVVDPISASIAYDLIKSDDKDLRWIESERHGILNENVDDTHSYIKNFLFGLEAERTPYLDRADPTQQASATFGPAVPAISGPNTDNENQ